MDNRRVRMKLLIVVCLIGTFRVHVESTIIIHSPPRLEYQPLPGDFLNPRCPWFTFSVKPKAAIGAARVALQAYYNSTRLMYEVFIGGWRNTRSVIRRSTTDKEDLAVFNGNVHVPNRFSPFWVSWEGGVISVGRGKVAGDNKIMTWTDPSPLAVNYVGVSTWKGRTADWKIDTDTCKTEPRFNTQFFHILHTTSCDSLTEASPTSITIVPSSAISCAVSCVHMTWCKSFTFTTSQQACWMCRSNQCEHVEHKTQNTSKDTGCHIWIS